MLRVILTTGGTGGHIFPALAVAEALKKRNPDSELLFMGATYGPEAEWSKKAGIPFIGLPGRGMLGRGLRAIPAGLDNLRALFTAIKDVRKFSPCAVAAFGGYASFPAAVAARILGVPLLLHEQNAIAGTVNRILGKAANIRCASLQDTGYFSKPYVVTGNPVRASLAASRTFQDTGHLLVIGGSQGAHALNKFVVSIAEDLKAAGIQVFHQTGQKDLTYVRNAYEKLDYQGAKAEAFIDDMAAAYAWADLALCRAGASTVAELCVVGLPAILVPFPAAIHDHQTLNAKSLQSAGAAIIIPEMELSVKGNLITDLVNNRETLASMSIAARKLAHPDAADLVAIEIEKLCRMAQVN